MDAAPRSSAESPGTSGTPKISVIDLWKSFSGKDVLRGVAVDVAAGDAPRRIVVLLELDPHVRQVR